MGDGISMGVASLDIPVGAPAMSPKFSSLSNFVAGDSIVGVVTREEMLVFSKADVEELTFASSVRGETRAVSSVIEGICYARCTTKDIEDKTT